MEESRALEETFDNPDFECLPLVFVRLWHFPSHDSLRLGQQCFCNPGSPGWGTLQDEGSLLALSPSWSSSYLGSPPSIGSRGLSLLCPLGSCTPTDLPSAGSGEGPLRLYSASCYCPQSFPASESFPMSQLFASGGQSIRVSASTSVLPINIQNWPPLGWTGWISFQSKGLSGVFSNTTFKSINFSVLSFLYSPTLTSIHDYWKNHSLDCCCC